MGSSTMENGASDEKYCDEVSKRPAFYPCQICGEFFTTRAMQVHKNTCLENENCQCSVCKSKSKKTDWENLKKKGKTSLNHSSSHLYKKKKKSKMNGQLQDHLLEKMGNEKHNTVDEYESELSTFKLVEKDSYLINKAVSNNKTLKHLDPSAIDECAENNEHECVSPPSETSESSQAEASDVSENSYYRPYEVVMLKDKLDHDCDRKLFCCFCNQHLYWESFGLHVIKHCQSVAAPNGGKRYLKCPDSKCDRQFSQPALFLTHYLSHNLEHPVECSDCLCSNLKCSAVSRVANEHGYAELEPFHCYICLTRFSHTQTVINHMRLHSKEMPYKCAVCDRTFRQIGNLQRHMTTHRGERPYKCSKCPSSFADPATLRNHERIHTGETPYVCNVCSRGFTQVGNLKRHMALHLQKDPASTTLQSTVEVSADENTIAIINPPEGLKINLNTEPQRGNRVKNPSDCTVTNISAMCRVKTPGRRNRRKSGKMKVFTCTICNKVYAWQHDLTVHFRTHTGEKPYGCELCGKHFAQSGAVRIHKDRHHSGVAIK